MITETWQKLLEQKGLHFLVANNKMERKKEKKGDFTYFITFIVLAAIKIFVSQTKISRIVIFESSYSFFGNFIFKHLKWIFLKPDH